MSEIERGPHEGTKRDEEPRSPQSQEFWRRFEESHRGVEAALRELAEVTGDVPADEPGPDRR